MSVGSNSPIATESSRVSVGKGGGASHEHVLELPCIPRHPVNAERQSWKRKARKILASKVSVLQFFRPERHQPYDSVH